MNDIVTAGFIERRIYRIRGKQVMLDRDLAALYGVPKKVLNQAVKRNPRRFPKDFMLQLTPQELRDWKSQIGISNPGIKMGLRKRPSAFTSLGVAMLSSVLNSERAIQVNMAIMRVFDRLRELIATLRSRYDKIVFDSPPIIGVSDASVLASAVDGAILLIQHRRNPQSMVLRAQQIVQGLKTPLVGVVLNQVPLNSGEDYGYYTNNYAYYSDGSGGKSRRGQSGPEGGDKLTLSEPGHGMKG